MFAIIFAMVTLQNVAPDPVVTPAASLGQSLTGKSGSSPLGLTDAPVSFGDVSIVAGCTYGTPPALGASPFQNLTNLSRTLTVPECAEPEFSGASIAPAFGMLGAPSLLTGYPVQLEPGLAATHAALSTGFVPSKTFMLQHLVLPSDFRGSSGPATVLPRAAAPTVASHASVRR